MEKSRNDHAAHVLVVTYPGQGHINPMLQFSKRLQQKGAEVTLVTTKFISRTTHSIPTCFPVETISDGYDEGGYEASESIHAYLDSLRRAGSQTLRGLLRRLSSSGRPVDCVVYDGFLDWVLEIAKEFGLVAAVFFTQSCAVGNIYYHVHRGLLKLPLPDQEILLPGLPPLQPPEMPSFVYHFGSYPAFYDLIVNQYANIDKADWILCNTFYELEQEVLDWMGRLWPTIRSVGPNIPSTYLDGRIRDDRDYGLNLFNPNSDATMKWLDGCPKASVIYLSFGSFAEIEPEQMEELALALKSGDNPFLWVVRASEEAKLPRNFAEETSEKGLVVSWCSQLEVLAHDSVGCFVTHCGWNSTLEALSLGVPMVAIPRWTDQTTNAKYIVDVWQAGLRAAADRGGIVRRETLVHLIREVMGGERGNEIRRNATRWKALARQAFDEGGSSDKNVDEMLAKLVPGVNSVSA